jgi:hypothetical protein
MFEKQSGSRCAQAGCPSHHISLLDTVMRGHIPQRLANEFPPEWQFWRCSLCEFVWCQPSSATLRADPAPLGYLTESGDFIEDQNVPVRRRSGFLQAFGLNRLAALIGRTPRRPN